MTFDPSKDGADRCEAFCTALVDLLRRHSVRIRGNIRDMQQVTLHHDSGQETGWILDMQDIQMLTNGENR